MSNLIATILLLGVCLFYRITNVQPWDVDPNTGAYVTWKVYFRPLEGGHQYFAKTWWPDYVPGDVIRMCEGDYYPWGEWDFNYLPFMQ
jgi:hypothetical protein